MTARQPLRVGVLTGDVVSSSRLDKALRNRMPSAIRSAVRDAQKAFGTRLIPYPADVFRGDSWQVLVADPPASARVGLFLRGRMWSAVRGTQIDTRIAIGIGPVDALPSRRVSEGTGPAFELSGRALDAMPRHRRLTLSAGEGPVLEGCAVVFALMDSLSRSWTAKQALAVAFALQDLSQDDIAARWPGGITQQAVAKHLAAAGWHGIRDGLGFLEVSLRA